jgi:membrane protease YdiL (CAAX protease family)
LWATISRSTAGGSAGARPGSGSGSGPGWGGWLLTGLIVLAGLAGVASGAQQGSGGQGSGFGDLESMRLSEVGETLSDWKRLLLILGSVMVLVLLWGGDAIRPMSLQRAGLRNVKALPAPVWFMSAFIVVLTPGLLYTSLKGMDWVTGGGGDSLRALAAPQGIAYLAGIAVALGLAYMAGKAAPQSGCKLDWIDVPVGVGLLLLVAPLVLMAGDLSMLVHKSLANGEPTRAIAHPLLQQMVDNRSDPWLWVLIATVILGAPIVEEVVYRVFVQSAFLRLTNHAWVSVIITAAIFGTMHAIGSADTKSPWYAAVTVGVLGLCCGGAFERTKRLGVPIAMHAAFNAANVAMAMWVTSPSS